MPKCRPNPDKRDPADEARALRVRTKMVLGTYHTSGDRMSDGVCKGVDPVVVEHALVELRRESALSARSLFFNLAGHSMILYTAPKWDVTGVEGDEELAQFVVRPPGSITGITRLDRALRVHLKKEGLLEVKPCVDDMCGGRPHGSGYFPTMQGIKFARRQAGAWDLKYEQEKDALAAADDRFVDDVREAARIDAAMFMGFVYEAMNKALRFSDAKFFAAMLHVPDSRTVSACGRALHDRGVVQFRGSRYRRLTW